MSSDPLVSDQRTRRADATPAEQLGAFLRHRRSLLDPTDLGLVSHSARRVDGLRREEVADLAGVSLTYYTRLEQGTATHPSTQILDALARAMRLSSVERAHLYRLAGGPPITPVDGGPSLVGIRSLIDRMPDVGAVVLSPVQDIVAWNRLGHVLLAPDLDASAPESPTPPNKVELVFCDPLARTLYRDWEHEASLAVSSLRFVSGTHADDPALASLVGRLSMTSPDFARLWAEHPVELCNVGLKRLNHPDIGRLDVTFQMLHLPENDGYRVLTMHAPPGSDDDHALRLLAVHSITE